MSYKTISDRNFQLVNPKKILCINKIKLPEDIIGVIKNFIFIHYYEAAIIKYAESRKKRVSNIFYSLDVGRVNEYWYKRYNDDISTVYYEGRNCLMCGEYLLCSYNRFIQARCSLPLCNCNDNLNNNEFIHPPYGNYDAISDEDNDSYYDNQSNHPDELSN